MKDLEEKRVCVKFCFKLRGRGTFYGDFFRCYNRLMERILWAVRNVTRVVEAETESDGTRKRTGGEVKGKKANGGSSRQSCTVSEHGLSSITTADAHTSAASRRLNWHPRRFKWTRPFRWKTKSGFCACAITFRFCSTSVSNRGERRLKTMTPKSGRSSTSVDDDHVEKVFAVIGQYRRLSVREVCWRSGNLWKFASPDFDRKKKTDRCVVLSQNLCRVCWLGALSPWIFDEAWHDCIPPASLFSRFGPCRPFLVAEVEILTKRSPISDGRGNRRKFDTGPSRRPAKHVPGRVPGMLKTLGAVYQE